MVTEKHISFIRLFKIIWRRLLKMTILSAAIVIPFVYFGLQAYAIDLTAPLILGTALSIFLGFRTNSANERWFAARGYWSSIYGAARNLGITLHRPKGRHINLETGKNSAKAAKVMPRMIRRAIAWAWALNRQLKDKDSVLDGLEKYLEPKELEILKTSHNPAQQMLYFQSEDYRLAKTEGQFTDGEHFEVVGILREMTAAQTSCEGLKATPFPRHYSFFTDVFIWMLIVLLSISLPKVEALGYLAIPLTVMVGWVFSMIEGIGDYMDDPFTDNRNVVPLDAISTNLERDLLAMALGETDIPEALLPVDGAIY